MPTLTDQKRDAASATDRATEARMLAASITLQPEVHLPPHSGASKHVLPSTTAPDSELPTTKFIARDEALHIRTSSRPLARLRKRAADTQEELHNLGADPDHQQRRRALREQIEDIERDMHGDARGTARSAVLAALDAVIKRNAARYTTTAQMLADEAANYHAACELRDQMLNTTRFDPMGFWSRVGAVLAPEPDHRPRGWSVVVDAYGRECLWTAGSDPHRRAVERCKAEIKTELQGALNGSGWPFEGAQ